VSANRTAIALKDYRRFYAGEIAELTALRAPALDAHEVEVTRWLHGKDFCFSGQS
jgi:hypothetical protein